ncbi:MAG: NAD-dependent epimerase/dehydratase family protein [Treponema sp.]|nr:NAD-dependent epimerase/dehydratase family protein [Treponema sp.]
MTITIIGGSGFVGTRLTKRFLEAGHSVRIADKRKSAVYPELWIRCDVRNAPDRTDEFPESITDADTAPGADRIAQEAQPMHSLMEAIEGSDAVVNLAAEHRDDVTPKSLYDDVNVRGSENVCRACSELGIRRIIFTSSVAVYGFAPAGTDEGGEIDYFNDYGRTKFLAEEKYRAWLKASAANSVVIVRPTVIFGEGNRGNVYNLLRQIAGGKFPMVGRGTNRNSMNYVENVAAFIQFCVENGEKLPCLEKGFDGASAGKLHLFNYCDEPAYDMNGLVLDVCGHLGKPRERLFHFPYWLAYCGGKCFDLLALVLHRKFAVSAIRVRKFCQNTYFVGTNIKETGFVPPVSLEDGLRATIKYEFIHKVQGHTFCCE